MLNFEDEEPYGYLDTLHSSNWDAKPDIILLPDGVEISILHPDWRSINLAFVVTVTSSFQVSVGSTWW